MSIELSTWDGLAITHRDWTFRLDRFGITLIADEGVEGRDRMLWGWVWRKHA